MSVSLVRNKSTQTSCQCAGILIERINFTSGNQCYYTQIIITFKYKFIYLSSHLLGTLLSYPFRHSPSVLKRRGLAVMWSMRCGDDKSILCSSFRFVALSSMPKVDSRIRVRWGLLRPALPCYSISGVQSDVGCQLIFKRR